MTNIENKPQLDERLKRAADWTANMKTIAAAVVGIVVGYSLLDLLEPTARKD